MKRYWVRLRDGVTEQWAIFVGEDEVAAHLKAVGIFAGTGWRISWPIPLGY